VKAVAVRPLMVGLLDSLILSRWASVGPWFEPRSRRQRILFGNKRFGRWPGRVFLRGWSVLDREVGIGTPAALSLGPTSDEASRAGTETGTASSADVVGSTICRYASPSSSPSEASRSASGMAEALSPWPKEVSST